MAEGRRERQRAKILAVGIDSLTPKEILEFLLFPFYPRIDTMPIAVRLLETFGNLDNVLNASPRELENNGKLPPSCAVYLSNMRPAVNRASYDGLIKTGAFDIPEFAKKYFQLKLGSLNHEEMSFMMLDIHYGFLRCENLAVGGVADAEIDVRRIAQKVIATGAQKVIMAHNHPGKSTKPSENDFHTTRDLNAILSGLDVELVDHIIVAGPEVYSMWQHGEILMLRNLDITPKLEPEMAKSYRFKVFK